MWFRHFHRTFTSPFFRIHQAKHWPKRRAVRKKRLGLQLSNYHSFGAKKNARGLEGVLFFRILLWGMLIVCLNASEYQLVVSALHILIAPSKFKDFEKFYDHLESRCVGINFGSKKLFFPKEVDLQVSPKWSAEVCRSAVGTKIMELTSKKIWVDEEDLKKKKNNTKQNVVRDISISRNPGKHQKKCLPNNSIFDRRYILNWTTYHLVVDWTLWFNSIPSQTASPAISPEVSSASIGFADWLPIDTFDPIKSLVWKVYDVYVFWGLW